MKNNKKISPEQMTYWVGALGYEILDTIVGPACGIEGIIADLYIASTMVYAKDEKQGDNIIKQIYKKYHIPNNAVFLNPSMPIALLALAIIEYGTYN